jgi:hypothetical protein
MSDTEDYPGPTQDQPDKEGQDPRGRADEEMVKPPAKPETERKKEGGIPAKMGSPSSRSSE